MFALVLIQGLGHGCHVTVSPPDLNFNFMSKFIKRHQEQLTTKLHSLLFS